MMKNWENLDEKQKRACLLIELFIRKESGFANWIYERVGTYSGLIEQACSLLNCTTLELQRLKEQYVSDYDKSCIQNIPSIISTLGINQFAYNFLVENSYNLPFVRDVCEYLNLSFEELLNYGSEYVLSKIDKNRDLQSPEWSNIHRALSASIIHIHNATIAGQTFQVNKRNSLFEFLLLLNDEETIEFIKNNIEGRVGFYSYDYIFTLGPIYGEEKAKQMSASIKAKLLIYREYKNQERKDDRAERLQLSESEIQIIEGFISCNLNTIGEYSNSVGIEASYFNSLVKRAKELNPELYLKYSNITSNLTAQRFKVITTKIKRMGEKIKTGIELPDGTKRPFDILDYYGLFSMDISNLEILLKNIKDMEPSDRNALYLFIKRNSKDKSINEKNVLGVENLIMMQDGSMRAITEIEKISMLSYLKARRIPLTLKTYAALKTKYIKGEINIMCSSEPLVEDDLTADEDIDIIEGKKQ